MRVELAHDAGGPREFPSDGLPELAVLGRSNVGKSTLINRLVGRRRLARTSTTPGKTRRIQFYRVSGGSTGTAAIYVVDLPGYGYAAVSRSEQRRWQPMVESYLRGSRTALRGALLLMDLRRDLRDEEEQLLEWLAAERIPTGLVGTKSDKLKAGVIARAAHKLSERLSPAPVFAVSARSGSGLRPLATWIRTRTDFTLLTPEGTPLPDRDEASPSGRGRARDP